MSQQGWKNGFGGRSQGDGVERREKRKMWLDISKMPGVRNSRHKDGKDLKWVPFAFKEEIITN
jgi:hypothetical protein